MKKELSIYAGLADEFKSLLPSVSLFPAYKMSGSNKPSFSFTKTLSAKSVVISSVNGLIVFTDIDTPANTGTTITLTAGTTGVKRYTFVITGDDAIKISNPDQCSTQGFGGTSLLNSATANASERILFPLTELIKFNRVDFNQMNGNQDPFYNPVIGDTFTLKSVQFKLAIGSAPAASLRGIYGDIANIQAPVTTFCRLPSQNTFGNIYAMLQEWLSNFQLGEVEADSLLYPQYFFLIDTSVVKISPELKSKTNTIKLYVDLGNSMNALLNWIASTVMTGLTSLEVYGTLTGSTQENADIATIKSNNTGLASNFKINGVIK